MFNYGRCARRCSPVSRRGIKADGRPLVWSGLASPSAGARSRIFPPSHAVGIVSPRTTKLQSTALAMDDDGDDDGDNNDNDRAFVSRDKSIAGSKEARRATGREEPR